MSNPAWWEIAYERLKSNDIKIAAHVPDAALTPLIRRLEEDPDVAVVPLAREEEGVGVLAGAFLGGMRGVLLMQNSGLGNCVNALAGLPMAYHIPFLMFISPRGRLGEFNPSQVPMGKATTRVLDALDIETVTMQRLDEVGEIVDQAARTCFNTNTPVAIIVSTLLTGGKRG
jgi:sulfopyruvate decarboxylase alpha subunit